MKRSSIIIIFFLTIINCKAQEVPTEFSAKALEDTFVNLDGDEVDFGTILKRHEGKTILIDIWASWCRDCIKGMPKVKKLQRDHSEIVYLFLSLDKTKTSWKKGIDKHELIGEHYYMQSGWKGDFATFLDLDWIPRYLVVDKDGTIKLFRAIKVDDKKIKESLN